MKKLKREKFSVLNAPDICQYLPHENNQNNLRTKETYFSRGKSLCLSTIIYKISVYFCGECQG